MSPDGKWLERACGVALLAGTGFGESHEFVCQYSK